MDIFASAMDYKDIQAVQDEYPSAARIVEVDGGWMVFYTSTDADRWASQAGGDAGLRIFTF